MGLKTEKKIIAGQEWSATAIPGSLVMDHSPWLLGLLATGGEKLERVTLGHVLELLEMDSMDAAASMDLGKAGGAIAAACAKLPPAEVRRLRTMMFESATVDVGGVPIPVLEAMDTGDIKGGAPSMWKGLWFTVVLSFGPFGAGLTAKPAAAKGSP